MNRINKPAMLLAIVAAAGMVAATMWTSTPAEELVETPAVPAPATPLQADMQQLQVATQASWQPVSAGSYDSRVDTREEVIYKADHLPVYPQFVDVESGEIQLCQYVSGCGSCGAPNCDGDCFPMSAAYGGQDPYGNGGQGGRAMVGVDGFNCHGREPGWTDQHLVPFEAFAYGEYVGPYRTPHLPEYRIRIGDQLEFIYMLTRDRSAEPYKFYVGDVISISSNTDVSLNVEEVEILSDGTISLDLIGQVVTAGKTVSDLQDELNEKYEEFVKKPGIVVRVVQSDTPLQDLRDAVDARAGQGGQARIVQVTPDGTFSLPLIGNVPAIGLSLDEVRREVNARYRMALRGGGGIEVTPALLQRAQSFVYITGQIETPGQIELNGPTTVMQVIAQAGQLDPGGNLRQVIVFRRDQNWRLQATRLDLAGAFYGRRPHPSDDIWLRNSDIIVIPPKPIQRFSDAVNLYLAQTVYAIFPQQGVVFNFDEFESL